MWFPLREKLGPTEFLGYETESTEGIVEALVRDGKEVAYLKKGETGAIVLNQTPFYGESGGQVGDIGSMAGEGVRFRVTDTKKHAGDVFVHLGTVEEGTLKPGAALALEVDHNGAGQSAKIIRRRICSMKRSAKSSATTLRKEARWLRLIVCASIFRIRSP